MLVLFIFICGSSQASELRFRDTSGSPIEKAYLGEQIVVSVNGLKDRFCRIEASLPSPSGGQTAYQSSATFQIPEDGSIRLDCAKALDGSYRGLDTDGLFWSMTLGAAKPDLVQGAYNFDVICQGMKVASSVLPLAYTKAGVRAVSLDGTGLIGRLFLPPGPGPHPAMITFGGSEGGSQVGAMNAMTLANHGYAALGLAYFGEPGVPKDLKEIPLEYFERAIQYLQKRPEIDGDRIGVMGASRGGELALLLGATFPQIKAVVGQVAGPILFGANVDENPLPSAWTFRGRPLPAITEMGALVPFTLPDGRTVYRNRPAFDEALKNKDAVARAFTPIERTNGPILMLAGEDDQVWPSCELAKMAMQRLKDKEHKYHDKMICYPQAGHGVASIPNLPVSTTIFHPQMKIWVDLGGTPEKNAGAIRDSWNQIFRFLKENLR